MSGLVVLVFLVLVAGTAAALHYTWLAKEWLLRKVAARMGVPYETQRPWWARWTP